MSAHTPGNWEVISDPGHFDTRTTVVSKDGGSRKGHPYRMIVQVGGWAGPREAEANARLIAAAPELLEALEDLASLAEAAMREVGEYDIEAELSDARAAIAKATGGAA